MRQTINRRRWIPLTVIVLGMTLCAAPLAANMTWYALGYRAESAGSYKVETIVGLTYAQIGKRALNLDIYRPVEATGQLPGVVIVHGGAWRYFNRTVATGFARLLASHGFAAATVDYRLSDEAGWPACLQDVKASVRWLRANARRFNLDPLRIGAVGDSPAAIWWRCWARQARMPDLTEKQALPGTEVPYRQS